MEGESFSEENGDVGAGFCGAPLSEEVGGATLLGTPGKLGGVEEGHKPHSVQCFFSD